MKRGAVIGGHHAVIAFTNFPRVLLAALWVLPLAAFAAGLARGVRSGGGWSHSARAPGLAEPGLAVTLTLRSQGGHAVFTVADDGRGIPADALPHLFDRFYRVDTARTRDTGGSGLGLPITREIVRMHDGEITAANAPGGGAVFTVRIPLHAGSADKK